MNAPVVGVLGGGQLGRMLALAGYPLGLRFRFLDPNPAAPAGQVGELVVGDYDDHEVLSRFVDGLSVVTYEFENVPVSATRLLAQRVLVHPQPGALQAAQDRLAEKSLFERVGVPVGAFAAVDGRETLAGAIEKTGLPAIMKTRRLGYDGKGQFLIRTEADVDAAWQALAGAPLILEQFIPFEREVSLLSVRGRDGSTACYPLVENHHRNGILYWSKAPAADMESLQQAAEDAAKKVLEDLDYVGLLAIEFFVHGGSLLANEMAPRVHNSGHWTIEGAATSQFANHLRAVVGLPLGSTRAVGRSAMVNLIGSMPSLESLLAIPDVAVHHYGKEERAGRKLGHATIAHAEPAAFDERFAALLRAVPPP